MADEHDYQWENGVRRPLSRDCDGGLAQEATLCGGCGGPAHDPAKCLDQSPHGSASGVNLDERWTTVGERINCWGEVTRRWYGGRYHYTGRLYTLYNNTVIYDTDECYHQADAINRLDLWLADHPEYVCKDAP